MILMKNPTENTFMDPKNDAYNILNMNKIISDKSFSNYCKTYIFATEYIRKYYEQFDLMNKSVLTVCSSGDHAFNALLNGANKVDTFDINVFAGYFMYFKKAMIESLSYNDFINNFYINIFDEVICLWTINDFLIVFEKICDKLDKNVLQFWQIIAEELINETKKPKSCLKKAYEFIRESASKNYCSRFFYCTESRFSKPFYINYRPVACNEYLASENKYCELQERLKGSAITFTNCDITQLPNVFNTTYDYLFTSNISSYLTDIYEDDYLNRYKSFIISGLSSLLNSNGTIALAYLYNICNNTYSIDNPMGNKEEREKVFGDGFEKLIVHNDEVITYRKIA